MRLFYVRLISFALFPIIVIIISSIFWVVKGYFQNIDSLERKDKNYSTIVIIVFLKNIIIPVDNNHDFTSQHQDAAFIKTINPKRQTSKILFIGNPLKP